MDEKQFWVVFVYLLCQTFIIHKIAYKEPKYEIEISMKANKQNGGNKAGFFPSILRKRHCSDVVDNKECFKIRHFILDYIKWCFDRTKRGSDMWLAVTKSHGGTTREKDLWQPAHERPYLHEWLTRIFTSSSNWSPEISCAAGYAKTWDYLAAKTSAPDWESGLRQVLVCYWKPILQLRFLPP